MDVIVVVMVTPPHLTIQTIVIGDLRHDKEILMETALDWVAVTVSTPGRAGVGCLASFNGLERKKE
jgi:hypothetical protein